MSSLSKGKRNSRKAKTSILYQIKNHVQQNVQVGQSINIVSLKNPYFNQKQPLQKIKEKSAETHTNYISKARTSQLISKNMRRAHQSGKLTITLKDQITEGQNVIERKQSRSSHSYSPKFQDINQAIQKMARNRIITIDKERMFADLKNFKTIIQGYVSQIDLLESENLQLLGKNRKFEVFLKQMDLKNMNEGEEGVDKNSQLKILNLQRKVETLNYIIKQYRTNNKQEIKSFEKKINEFKPTLEAELMKMLSQANQKNKQLEGLVQYFKKQCVKHCKNVNWVSFVQSLKDKDEQISQLTQKVNNLTQQYFIINEKYEEDKKVIQQFNVINSENMELKWKIELLQKTNEKLKSQALQKQQKYYEIHQEFQQLTYKYQALQSLQVKINHKEETVRRNTLVINRLQDQNYCLKAKLETFKNNEEKKIFNEDYQLQQKIEKRNNNVEELSKRFFQEIDNLPQQYKETASFVSHLFGKIKDYLEGLINQYRQQLLTKAVQLSDEKKNVENILNQNRIRNELCQEILSEQQQIDAKRKRCVDSQEKLGQTDSCSSCMNWMLHWGQINNLYGQIRIQIDKLSKVI